MIFFLARRLGHLLLTLLLASFLLFLATSFSPGTVASKILGPYALDSQVRILSDKLGLEDPLPIRYGRWLGVLLGLRENPLGDPALELGLSDPRGDRYPGNLGYSLMLKRPVLDVLGDRLGNTAWLTFWAIALVVPVSLTAGIIAGIHHGRILDRGVSLLTVILTSLPEFVVAVALLMVFSHGLGWLPGTSPMLPGGEWSGAAQLVLPVLVLTIASASYVARIVRASVVETLSQPYVRAARLKGLRGREVIVFHVLRNAMIAPVTVILLQINWLLTGVVVVEAIFAYPGLGLLLLNAALFGDIYTVQALTLLALTIAVGTQVLGDMAYRWLDPRVRLG